MANSSTRKRRKIFAARRKSTTQPAAAEQQVMRRCDESLPVRSGKQQARYSSLDLKVEALDAAVTNGAR